MGEGYARGRLSQGSEESAPSRRWVSRGGSGGGLKYLRGKMCLRGECREADVYGMGGGVSEIGGA